PRARLAGAVIATARVPDLRVEDVAARPACDSYDRRGDRTDGATRARTSHVVRRLLLRRARPVVMAPCDRTAAHERQRSDAYGGRLCRSGNGRRSVAANEETHQCLDPRCAAESGGHVAEAMPQAGARADEQRANRSRAERELGRKLAVAEPADLAQQEGVAL